MSYYLNLNIISQRRYVEFYQNFLNSQYRTIHTQKYFFEIISKLDYLTEKKTTNYMVVRTEKSYSDSEIMNILRNGDADEKETIKKHLYLVHRGIALSQISKKGINPRKFEDLYADSMVMLYRRIESGLFRGETKISSYFFDIFRYAIIGSFKKTGNIPDGFSIVEVPEEFENAFLKNNILEKLTPLLEETFDKLKGTNCKKALSAELQEVERHKISGILGFKHPKSLDNALSKCRKKLRKFIESNPTLEYQIKALYYELIR